MIANCCEHEHLSVGEFLVEAAAAVEPGVQTDVLQESLHSSLALYCRNEVVAQSSLWANLHWKPCWTQCWAANALIETPMLDAEQDGLGQVETICAL